MVYRALREGSSVVRVLLDDPASEEAILRIADQFRCHAQVERQEDCVEIILRRASAAEEGSAAPSREARALTAAVLLAEIARLRDRACVRCAATVCAHQALMAVAMGARGQSLCLRCLADDLQTGAAELCEHLCGYIQHRDCYREAWERVSREEGVPPTPPPPCCAGF